MSHNRTLKKENLAKGAHFSIDVVVKNQYTHSIQISHLPSEAVLQTIPFDPTDRTVTGSISKEALSPLGSKEVNDVLKILSEVLISKFGAKELFVVSAEMTLPNFTAPEDSGFDRLRHCERQQLQVSAAEILKEHKDLTAELDKNYHFVRDEKSLMSGRDPHERYQEINSILEQTRFTSGKLAEYKQEELQGKMSRFKSEFIRPIVMLNKEGNIAGMLRALLMGNNFAYLSDEVINQDIVPFQKFFGESLEQKSKRELFLLAYLMSKACQFGLADQSHVIIIAANGREKMYEQVGFKKFPLNLHPWNAKMKLSPPGPILTKAQTDIKSLAVSKSVSNTQYGKYFGVGAAFLAVGLFAYRFCKTSPSIAEIKTIKPQI